MEKFSVQNRKRQENDTLENELDDSIDTSGFVLIHEEHCLVWNVLTYRQPISCINIDFQIGTQGAAIVPAVNLALDSWVELRSKDVTYLQRRESSSGTKYIFHVVKFEWLLYYLYQISFLERRLHRGIIIKATTMTTIHQDQLTRWDHLRMRKQD